jgi:hypothetical protein
MFSTRRMELGLPHLEGFEFGSLLAAQQDFRGGDRNALTEIAQMMAKAGRSKAIRSLSAIVRASEAQLQEAELNPQILAQLEEEAAERPFRESFLDAAAFFIEWGNSLADSPDSSSPLEKTRTSDGPKPGAELPPSGDS